MELSPLALIGIGLAVMFFGYFFGLFEGRGQGYKRRQREEGAQPPLPSTPVNQPAATRNLMELGRDQHGQTVLQLEGRRVEAASLSVEDRKRLIEIMVLLRPWIEPAARPSAVGPARPGTAQPPVGAQTPVTAAVPESRSGGPVVAPVTSAVPPAPPASLSLVGQIDAILQARLAGTRLAARGIRLAESLHGGATVFIGTSQYEGVDRVPDPEVQAAIRAAIAEWEKTYPPR